jgi:purine-nucleoside phosphorylase
MLEKIKQTAEFIEERITNKPKIGIILGSGLGNLGETIEDQTHMPYSQIPNFPVSTVKGHKGQLVFGKLGGKDVVAMQGRFHFYEGYGMQELTFPIRVFKELGIQLLIVSNAAGGMNPNFSVGDIMVITDHINMFPTNPLMGANEDALGARFPDMSEPYDRTLIEKMNHIAQSHSIKIHNGVYVGVSGPCFETPAEYRAFRIIGGDAVGMSTVPEVIVARHAGIPCFACSVITDLGGGDVAETVSHEEVIAAANAAEPILTKLITQLLSEI